MEDQRRHLAEKEAKARASEKQILEDADHLVAVEKSAKPSGCRSVLADHRRRHHGRLLDPANALPSAAPPVTSTCERLIGTAARP